MINAATARLAKAGIPGIRIATLIRLPRLPRPRLTHPALRPVRRLPQPRHLRGLPAAPVLPASQQAHAHPEPLSTTASEQGATYPANLPAPQTTGRACGSPPVLGWGMCVQGASPRTARLA